MKASYNDWIVWLVLIMSLLGAYFVDIGLDRLAVWLIKKEKEEEEI